MELTQPSDAVVSWLSVAGDDAASSDGTALASSCGEDSDGECSLLSPPGPPSPTAAHVPGECPAAPLLDEVPPVSPRMREIYETLEVQPYPNVRSVLDAAAMPPHLFGRLNASVRAWAVQELGASISPSSSQLSASASSSSSHATALVAESAECGCFALATSAASSAMPACTPAPPIASDGWVSSASIEDAKIRRAIDDLLRVLPHSLLFSTNGSVPVEVQHENLIERLARFDAGSIRRGQSVWASWMSFCQRHSLPDFGSPFDGDLCLWFLREEDEAARRAAASTSSSRTGATVKHARACSLRWLNSAVGIPFRADLPTVRSASKPDRSREPSFVPMWDVAVLRHLLRIAVCYRGQRAQFFRSYAASAYVMGIASLRQVDALRSPPPTVQTVDGVSCLHSVAEFTKALSRASMRPMPWWIPTTSIDPDLDDAAVLEGLRAAFALLPPHAPSMFLEVIGFSGRVASVAEATAWGNRRASEAHLRTSLAFLFMWHPLALLHTEATQLASRKHGPRHTFPEIARAIGMPESARDELGRWKEKGGRLKRLANRYSRAAERSLQLVLRNRIILCIRAAFQRGTGFCKPTLTDMVSSSADMTRLQLACVADLQRAGSSA